MHCLQHLLGVPVRLTPSVFAYSLLYPKVMEICFLKGASVLADGYLVAGSLTRGQAECIFGLGVFLQLRDDSRNRTCEPAPWRQPIGMRQRGRNILLA